MRAEQVGKLDTAAQVRRELARLYRAGRRGDVAPGDCSKLASVLGLILRSIEVHDLERRVQAIEQRP